MQKWQEEDKRCSISLLSSSHELLRGSHSFKSNGASSRGRNSYQSIGGKQGYCWLGNYNLPPGPLPTLKKKVFTIPFLVTSSRCLMSHFSARSLSLQIYFGKHWVREMTSFTNWEAIWYPQGWLVLLCWGVSHPPYCYLSASFMNWAFHHSWRDGEEV